MRTVRSELLGGVAAQAAILLTLGATAGLTGLGSAVGAGCAGVTDVLVARGVRRRGTGVGPADRVTFLRAALAGGVAALVASGAAAAPVVGLAAVGLALDLADGWLARRTGTVSAFGARFDMEVDAFLILVLSVRVAQHLAPVALAIGLARYLFVAAGVVAPWLRGPVPPRYWRKVVAAVQGVVLTVGVSGLLPVRVAEGALLVALGLLAESFGRDVLWLGRHARRPAPSSRLRTASRWGSTALGIVVVWFALLGPDRLEDLSAASFLRIPVEALVLLAFALVLPAGWRNSLAALAGGALGVLALLRVLDLAFNETLDRPFNPVGDWGSFAPAVGVLRDSAGSLVADALVAVAVLAAVAVPVAAGAFVLRASSSAARHRRRGARSLLALAAAWAVAAGVGAPLASGDAARAVYAEGRAVDRAIADQHRFAAQLAGTDPLRAIPPGRLLSGLRGKDVLLVFVESYGRVAVQGSSFSPGVDAVLTAGNARLQRAGFGARSAFLTSPTFGGISWLAHSTLQSGLWVDSALRYGQLVASDRYTLSDAFGRAGWRTVVDVPSNGGFWPQGRSFYHYDAQYNLADVGYAGPRFSYATMPDQFTLAALRRNELLRPGRAPVMAEIDLVSSHTPWTPLPRLVGWDEIGDGSVYAGMPELGPAPADLWRSTARVRQFYGRSIQYSLESLISYVTTFRDPNLVVVVLGDHQPAKIVSGSGAGHDVPVSVISADPAVIDRVAAWGWEPGLRPGPHAPVQRMDTFRDRFVRTFSAPPTAGGS